MSAPRGRMRDSNHAEMVAALECMGAHVETIQGHTPGTPDLLVRIFGMERTAEVKPVGKDLNPAQVKWWMKWGVAPVILRTTQDCEALVASMRGRMTRSDVEVDPSDYERPVRR